MSNIAVDLKPLVQPLTKLKPANHNPRKGDVDAIRRSYERFGQRKPIVADRKTGEIIAGNHQYLAAKDLGWTEIAVVFVDDDAETATAYAVADNRIGQLGDWDVAELVASFEKMSAEDYESVGFTEADVEDYRALLDEHEMTAPAIPQQDGGLGDRAGKVSADPDLQVKKDSSYSDFLERYANRAVRAIILYYPNDDYNEMIANLEQLSKKLGTADNAETVASLVRDRLRNA